MKFDRGMQRAEDWVDVCRVEQVIPDRGVCALVGGESVALFRLSETDEIYAVGNWDPFSRAAVLSRGIVGDKKGELVIISPIYKNAFNLKTGLSQEDPSIRIPTYPARQQNGVIQIQPTSRPSAQLE